MPKKVIQVPVDAKLLEALDALSRKRGTPRAELIRESCQLYLRRVEDEEGERAYVQGYRAIPEGPELGEAQATLASETLPTESW
ncbi:MAG: ribbon-helix-helix protein, CopG family [Dehalococcoidia bacterium]|nr:ribbon-helix-helix protein, CopG family [Dehalococcoidia bacterium]